MQSMRGGCLGCYHGDGGAELWILSERPPDISSSPKHMSERRGEHLAPQCPRAVGSSDHPWASCTQGALSAVQGQLGGARAGMERVCLCQLLGLAHREALWGGRAALPGERQPRSRIQVLSVGRDEPGISEVGGPLPTITFS